MAITRYPPNTIHLGGRVEVVNDIVASEAITPGHLIERHSASGTPKFRKHATAGGDTGAIVAREQSMLNRDVDTAYASGDLVEAIILAPGATAWMLVASGANITAGQKLESAGNGLLRAIASGKALFTALVDTNNSAGPSTMRIKVEAL